MNRTSLPDLRLIFTFFPVYFSQPFFHRSAMKPEEARFILAAVRPPLDTTAPTLSAPEDPNVTNAIRVMQNDAELKLWYAQRCRFDRAVADQISAIAPPADLESNILAGLKVSGLIPWWQRRTFCLVAVAASIMVIAAITHMTRQPLSPVADNELIAENTKTKDFRSSVIGEITHIQNLDHESDQSSQLVAWLNQQGAPTLTSLDLPSYLGDAEVVGCKLLEWKGHRVSLMCFPAPDSAGKTHSFHLVIINEEALPDIVGDHPLIASEAGWMTALWRQGTKVVMLVTDSTNPDELRRQRRYIMFTQVTSHVQKSVNFWNKPSPPLLLPSKRSLAA